MVAKVARLHLHPANPLGALRALVGWAIALAGLVILIGQSGLPLAWQQAGLGDALLGGAMSAGATALGALPVLLSRSIGQRTQGLLLGFGAGVMLAASLFSLLLPAFDAALVQGMAERSATTLVGLGLALGAALLFLLDRVLPHEHVPGRERSSGAVWLFVLAIAVHNIPEGLAIGVAAGGSAGNAVATGISLQNVPEGLIVAIALLSAGYGRLLAFAVSAVSGLMEPLAALFGSFSIALSQAMLPWSLAAAAGAMLFVVSHEIIPESHRRGHESLATAGLIAGFVLMMMLDQLLG